ncbi:MAG TPA: hypothetical protein ENN03_01630 [bacterium]|nr:hypothetical protein [bacterium]
MILPGRNGMDTDWLFFGETLLREAAERELAGEVPGGSVRIKSDGSYVTDSDIRIETLLRRRLRARFPDHGIRGEEQSSINEKAAFQWMIDPIDGTHSFVHKIPLYGMLLALSHEDCPVMGWIFLPALNLMISGAKGTGLRVNGRPRPAARKDARDPAREIIATGERHQFEAAGLDALWVDLARRTRHLRTYCDCFGHAMTVLGATGVMVDVHLKVWDWQATTVLMREAGGVLLRADSADSGTSDLLFGKPDVIDVLIRTWDKEGISHPWTDCTETA